MRFALLFLGLGVASTAGALWLRGPFLIGLWPAWSFFQVALGYFGVGARVFGKRKDGTLPLWSVVLLLPYLIAYGLGWHLVRRFKSEAPFHELERGVFVGRRLLAGELPDDIAVILDLTCEMPEPAAIRSHPGYRSIPILDGHNPRPSQLLEAVDAVLASDGAVYVHCAEGHGRAGMVAAAVLLARGHADDVDMAIEVAQQRRPGIRLRPHQRAFFQRVAPEILARAERASGPHRASPGE